jgi:photosystem II stability/assembly factor-like uncharacterized protein
MAGQGRPTNPVCLGLLLGLIASSAGLCDNAARADNAAQAESATQADDAINWLRGDAQLTDVTFVDAQNGWAVGDRGAIWHTSDGGEHWQLQESNVDCRLTSVQFLDARTGWVAGGRSQPYTQVSQGVLLSTRDGGQHWSQQRKMLLPALTSARFLDKSHGWAIGRASSLFTSGVFTTEDGGRSWTSLPAPDQAVASTGPTSGPTSAVWTTGDFVDPMSGALGGPRGALATVRRRGTEPSHSSDISLRAWHRLQLFGPARAWAVGDGAWVLRSEDLGKSWQTPAGEFPGNYRDSFDFHALAARGERCWIAGAPGSRVLHTPDGGKTWTIQATGQPLPIRGLAFCDDQHGWAVGDLGLILGTRDGGQTWRRQRAGGARAAVLGCFSTPAALPLELFAKLSADEGYLGIAEVLNRQDLEAPADAADLDARTHEALVRAGASGSEFAWRFPLRQSGLNLSCEQLIDGWNRANDGQGLERLEGHVVQKIRQWRPSIVVTSAGESRAGNAVNDTTAHSAAAQQVITRIILRAVEHAADPTRFSEQITLAGLEPWKVQKVYAALPPGELGTTNITTSHVSGRWGRSLAELAAAARGLLMASAAPAEPAMGFRLLVDHVPQEQGKRDFFSGIALSPGGEARRALPEINGQNLDELRRAAQSRRNLQAILARGDDQDSPSDTRWLAEIGELTRSLDANSGAEVVFQLAERYYRRGRWQQAADSFELLAQRYPEHPLAGASLIWLVQYYSSSEAQWRMRRGQGRVARQVVTVPVLGPQFDRAKADGGVKRASAVEQRQEQRSMLPDLTGNESWSGRAAAFGKQLEQLQPTVFAEPDVRFPLAASHRAQGLGRQAERYYLGLQRARFHDAWWTCAQGEQWLADPRGVCPKSIWTCRRAPVRPRLDGQLDDPVWRSATPIELRSEHRDDAEWPAVAMAAFDAEYLYLALSCRPAPGAKYESSPGPRTRDADLSRHDRVDILIDLDRDWTTAYRLTIDHRGWTGEACWRDTNWNPDWFVAAKTEDGAWTAEAAIPLAELTGEPPTAKTVWAIGAQRTVPGVGFQSWTRPASIAGQGEGFGYLIFE